MTRPRTLGSILLAFVTTSAALAGCLGTGGDGEEAGGAEDEILLTGVATPENPAVGAVNVTDDTSSIKLAVSLTRLHNDTLFPNETDDNLGEEVTNATTDEEPERGLVNVTVIVFIGGAENVTEEVFNRTYQVGPDTSVQVTEDFGGDVVQKALAQPGPTHAVNLHIEPERGEISVHANLRANQLL